MALWGLLSYLQGCLRKLGSGFKPAASPTSGAVDFCGKAGSTCRPRTSFWTLWSSIMGGALEYVF